MATTLPNFDGPFAQVKSPSKFAHVVLRTGNFSKMVEFYKTLLGAEATYENKFISFLTYDEEHHRIAILDLGAKPLDRATAGLEHVAFAFDSVAELLLAYRQRKAKGIEPVWCVNHGPTLSLYYQDPDGNEIEMQVDSFSTNKEAAEFMASKEFEENPIGVDFDPDELIRKLKEGVSEKELLKRKHIGPRGMDSVPRMPVPV
ncbi:Biphenyl-2,3-diol 1,2-dioxygenase [Lachnellula hyalina]|uniref:Biphenyl-2,3-diol 1,2-dioxygenase n=1 Tax=Lachnellula hyalina TaxID=1316788 RepID=A0A8H8U471_9HELO|nr:Biphenyl-2,3-diol 1,2-dioxygenase [Lachnellula hyalina]TVY30805.1 Biphenyl-2,3-diol 1,2-dioxygenase [Lachnellula hyalina]